MDGAGGLRERKKVRTRADIVTATVDLSAEHGFEATTVAAIAARAEISQRTFFRFFATKEDAVLGLESDLFDAAIEVLARPGQDGALGRVLGDAIAEATTRFDARWHDRFTVAARIIDEVAPVEAAGLRFCARTGERLLELLRPVEPGTPDHVVELALESTVAAWRLARRDWLRSGDPDPEGLRNLLRRNVDALAPASTLRVTPGCAPAPAPGSPARASTVSTRGRSSAGSR